MGYESKLYIVKKSKLSHREDGKVFGEVIATFDLCKVYEVSDVILKKYKPTNCFIFADNGDDEITEDLYGAPLIEIPISDMISILEKVMEESGYYRRYKPCLSLLKGFKLSDWNDIVVLHYGH